jgi:hypothetical protein
VLMGHDDSQRVNGNRRSLSQKFAEASGNYSPSTSYNYSPGSGGYQQAQHQSHHPRRRSDRFKRESINQYDRLAKQNDVIIRLLKEIRDRLPRSAGQNSNSYTHVRDDAPAQAAPQDDSPDSPDMTDA